MTVPGTIGGNTLRRGFVERAKGRRFGASVCMRETEKSIPNKRCAPHEPHSLTSRPHSNNSRTEHLITFRREVVAMPKAALTSTIPQRGFIFRPETRHEG